MKNAIEQAAEAFAKLLRRQQNVPKGQLGQMQSVPQKTKDDMKRQQELINILRKNVLDQTNYTPQARAYLEKLPITAMPPGGDRANVMGGTAAGKYFPGTRSIQMNPKYLERDMSTVNILRHEFNHALDGNIHDQNRSDWNYYPENRAKSWPDDDGFAVGQLMNYLPQGRYTANSMNFMKDVGRTGRTSTGLNRFLELYKEAPDRQVDPQTRDIEGWAEFGSMGHDVLGSSVGKYYNNVYAPMNRLPINYSPMYSSARAARRY